MKVLIVSSGYYPSSCGGVEIISQVLAEGLVERGYEIVVLYSNESVEVDDTYYHNGIKVIKLKPSMIHIFNQSITSKINRILQMYNIFNIGKIRNVLKNENPDLVHIQMPRIVSYSVYTACNRENIPIVATLHEYYSLWNFNPFLTIDHMMTSKPTFVTKVLRNLQKKATRETRYVTAPFEDVIKKYKSEGYFTNTKFKEVLNALKFAGNAQSELTNKKRRLEKDKVRKFLIISRLVNYKGIERVLDAFVNYDNEMIELHIAGDGPLRSLVEKYCSKDSRIKYHGYVMNKDKENLFRSTDVMFFLPADIETFGLTILEAYYYCMPVIISNVNAVSKHVDNGATGLILNEVSNSNIVNAMKQYINYLEWDFQLECCLKKLQKYSCDNFIDEFEEVYFEVLKTGQVQ